MKIFYITILASLLSVAGVFAQTERGKRIEVIKERIARKIQVGDSVGRVVKDKVDRVLDARQKITTDTNFVARPDKDWTLRIKSDGVDNFVHLRTENSVTGNNDYIVSSPYKSTIGFAANYRGISLSASMNPLKLLGKYSEVEYDLNYYNNRYGVDLSYSRIRSLRGRSKILDFSDQVRLSHSRLRQTSVSAYYVFNGKRFSYPAVFNNTWIQRRSAGSWLCSLTYYDGRLTTNGEVAAIERDGHPLDNVKLRYLAIGVGYGYNYVPSSRWLIHASVLPGMILYKSSELNYMSSDEEDVPSYSMPYRFWNVCVTGRVGLSYSWSKYFVGANAVIKHFKAGNDASLSILNTRWKGRIYFGLRL